MPMLRLEVDAFDVRSGMNPCAGIQPGKIFVGGEQDRPVWVSSGASSGGFPTVFALSYEFGFLRARFI